MKIIGGRALVSKKLLTGYYTGCMILGRLGGVALSAFYMLPGLYYMEAGRRFDVFPVRKKDE